MQSSLTVLFEALPFMFEALPFMYALALGLAFAAGLACGALLILILADF